MTSKNRLKSVTKATGGVGRKRLLDIQRQPNGQPSRRPDGSAKHHEPFVDHQKELRAFLTPEDEPTFRPHVSDPLTHFRAHGLPARQYAAAMKYRVVGRLLRTLQEAREWPVDVIGGMQPQGTLKALRDAEGMSEAELKGWLDDANAAIRSPVGRGVCKNICIGMSPLFTHSATVDGAISYWELLLKHNMQPLSLATARLADFYKITDAPETTAAYISTTPISSSEKHWRNA